MSSILLLLFSPRRVRGHRDLLYFFIFVVLFFFCFRSILSKIDAVQESKTKLSLFKKTKKRNTSSPTIYQYTDSSGIKKKNPARERNEKNQARRRPFAVIQETVERRIQGKKIERRRKKDIDFSKRANNNNDANTNHIIVKKCSNQKEAINLSINYESTQVQEGQENPRRISSPSGDTHKKRYRKHKIEETHSMRASEPNDDDIFPTAEDFKAFIKNSREEEKEKKEGEKEDKEASSENSNKYIIDSRKSNNLSKDREGKDFNSTSSSSSSHGDDENHDSRNISASSNIQPSTFPSICFSTFEYSSSTSSSKGNNEETLQDSNGHFIPQESSENHLHHVLCPTLKSYEENQSRVLQMLSQNIGTREPHYIRNPRQSIEDEEIPIKLSRNLHSRERNSILQLDGMWRKTKKYFREIKSLTSSPLEKLILKATRPSNERTKDKHLVQLLQAIKEKSQLERDKLTVNELNQYQNSIGQYDKDHNINNNNNNDALHEEFRKLISQEDILEQGKVYQGKEMQKQQQQLSSFVSHNPDHFHLEQPQEQEETIRTGGGKEALPVQMQPYRVILRKLWKRMLERDWRCKTKALFLLHRISRERTIFSLIDENERQKQEKNWNKEGELSLLHIDEEEEYMENEMLSVPLSDKEKQTNEETITNDNKKKYNNPIVALNSEIFSFLNLEDYRLKWDVIYQMRNHFPSMQQDICLSNRDYFFNLHYLINPIEPNLFPYRTFLHNYGSYIFFRFINFDSDFNEIWRTILGKPVSESQLQSSNIFQNKKYLTNKIFQKSQRKLYMPIKGKRYQNEKRKDKLAGSNIDHNRRTYSMKNANDLHFQPVLMSHIRTLTFSLKTYQSFIHNDHQERAVDSEINILLLILKASYNQQDNGIAEDWLKDESDEIYHTPYATINDNDDGYIAEATRILRDEGGQLNILHYKKDLVVFLQVLKEWALKVMQIVVAPENENNIIWSCFELIAFDIIQVLSNFGSVIAIYFQLSSDLLDEILCLIQHEEFMFIKNDSENIISSLSIMDESCTGDSLLLNLAKTKVRQERLYLVHLMKDLVSINRLLGKVYGSLYPNLKRYLEQHIESKLIRSGIHLRATRLPLRNSKTYQKNMQSSCLNLTFIYNENDESGQNEDENGDDTKEFDDEEKVDHVKSENSDKTKLVNSKLHESEWEVMGCIPLTDTEMALNIIEQKFQYILQKWDCLSPIRGFQKDKFGSVSGSGSSLNSNTSVESPPADRNTRRERKKENSLAGVIHSYLDAENDYAYIQ